MTSPAETLSVTATCAARRATRDDGGSGEATALGPAMASTYNASTRRKNPRRSKKSASDCRCSSQATQVFSRSGAWTVGLFQTRAYDAGARQPFAEQTTGSLICCARLRVTRRHTGRAPRCRPSPA